MTTRIAASPSVHILIVDDHAILRRGCRDILASELEHAEIAEATDTNEAIEALGKKRFDLVILDLNLPGRGGLEVLQEARRQHAGIPVLVLSAYAEEEFAVRAYKLGAAAYLNKQGAPDELMTAVRKVLAGGTYVSAGIADKCAAALGRDVAVAQHEALSSRELQVMQWLARGKTQKEIASELSLSEKTIATYRSRISQKMNLSNAVELTRYAMRHGLVD
jgi:two-component system, NarL family, invasion response regulator UvrY